jgi:hypothetical protein
MHMPSPFYFTHRARLLVRVRREISGMHRGRPPQAVSIEAEQVFHTLAAVFRKGLSATETPEISAPIARAQGIPLARRQLVPPLLQARRFERQPRWSTYFWKRLSNTISLTITGDRPLPGRNDDAYSFDGHQGTRRPKV